MNRNIMVATIAAFIIGILISFQFQTQREVNTVNRMQQERLNSAEKVMNDLQEKSKELKAEYTSLSAEIDEFKNQNNSNTVLKARLEQINIMNGTQAVEGYGIRMTIQDNGINNNIILINPEYLNKIVNYLRLAGAEAISINSQRIVATTSIVISGNSTILVNSVPLSKVNNAAFDVLVSYLSSLNETDLKYLGYKIDIVREAVKIPSYKGGYNIKDEAKEE